MPLAVLIIVLIFELVDSIGPLDILRPFTLINEFLISTFHFSIVLPKDLNSANLLFLNSSIKSCKSSSQVS